MKEVTICFSFSVKDGQTERFTSSSGSPNGSSGLGEVDTEKLMNALKNAYSLLQRELNKLGMVTIKQPTLWVRWRVNTLDDLKSKNTTHAKSDKL